MKKFLVYLLVIVVAVSLGFAVFYLVRDDEVISISSASVYKDVGETFTIDVDHVNKKSYTEISISSSDDEIVSYSQVGNNFTALSGGVARINFRTSNVSFRNLWCDVIVGDGTIESPYYISTAEQLASIGMGLEITDVNNVGTGIYAGRAPFEKYQSDMCYKLVSDVDVALVNNGYWVPLRNFSGRFDGNGLTISNINIDRDGYVHAFQNETTYDPNLFSTTNVGFVQKLTSSGVIYNLKFSNYNAKGVYDTFGTIAGVNEGKIERMEIKSAFLSVETTTFGGLVGKNITTESGTGVTYERTIARIDRSSINMTLGQTLFVNDEGEVEHAVLGVLGTVGGLVGENNGGTIVYSYVTGDVYFGDDNTSAITFGGLVAKNNYATLNRFGGTYSNIYQGANVKDSYSNLTTHLLSTPSSDSLIAGAIAINNDYKQGIFDNDATKQKATNYLVGIYYNKDNLNKVETDITKNFVGVAKFNVSGSAIAFVDTKTIVFGMTAAELKSPTKFVSHIAQDLKFNEDGISQGIVSQEVLWLFDKVWAVESDTNNGMPYLNYQLIYVPDDFRTAGVPIILNSIIYMFELVYDAEVKIISGTVDENGQRILYIEKGQTQTLKVNPTGVQLTWVSANDQIVSVDASGKITAQNFGSVTITITTRTGYTDSIIIIVPQANAVSLTFNPAKVAAVYSGNTLSGAIVVTGTCFGANVTSKLSFKATVTASNNNITILSVVGNQINYLISGAGDGSIGISILDNPNKYYGAGTVAFVVSTSGNGDNGGNPGVATYYYLSNTTVSVDLNKTISITILSNNGNSFYSATETVVNTEIAEVTKSGNQFVITGITAGTTTLRINVKETSSSAGQWLECTINVNAGTNYIDFEKSEYDLTVTHVVYIKLNNATGPVTYFFQTITNQGGLPDSNAYFNVINKGLGGLSVELLGAGTVYVKATDSNGSTATTRLYITQQNTLPSDGKIRTSAQLASVKDALNGVYELGADFAITGTWTPIGTDSQPFVGILDGKGRTITINANISSGSLGGLFGCLDGATIRNLNIKLNNTISAVYAGAIAGIARNNSKIENCTITNANIKATTFGGGLVGMMHASTINNSQVNNSSIATSATTSYAGGLAGRAADGTITNSQAKAGSVSLSAGGYAGGIAGNITNVSIGRCIVSNDIFGYRNGSFAGGIVGIAMGSTSTITACVIESANIQGYYAGGIGGELNLSKTMSIAFGNYKNSYAYNDLGNKGALNASDVNTCSVKSNVKIEGYDVGGLFGIITSGHVKNCYTLARLTNKGGVSGGFASYIKSDSNFKNYGGTGQVGVVSWSYSACTFGGGSDKWAVTKSLVHNYYKGNDSYARSAGYVFNYVFLDTSGVGYVESNNTFGDWWNDLWNSTTPIDARKTSAQMSSGATFTSKDFSLAIWQFGAGYPTLSNQPNFK